MFDPSQRVYDVQNNAYHYPQALWDFYDAYNDTVQTADSINIPNGTCSDSLLDFLIHMFSH